MAGLFRSAMSTMSVRVSFAMRSAMSAGTTAAGGGGASTVLVFAGGGVHGLSGLGAVPATPETEGVCTQPIVARSSTDVHPMEVRHRARKIEEFTRADTCRARSLLDHERGEASRSAITRDAGDGATDPRGGKRLGSGKYSVYEDQPLPT